MRIWGGLEIGSKVFVVKNLISCKPIWMSESELYSSYVKILLFGLLCHFLYRGHEFLHITPSHVFEDKPANIIAHIIVVPLFHTSMYEVLKGDGKRNAFCYCGRRRIFLITHDFGLYF
jgi:hypothetical protein